MEKERAKMGGAPDGRQAMAGASSHQSSKQRKVDIFQRPSFDHPLLGSIQDLTVESILQLKDPEEATSFAKASLILSKLVHPISYEEFMQQHWERKPLLAPHMPAASKKPPVNANFYLGGFPTRKSIRSLLSSHFFKPNEDFVVEGVELSDEEVSGKQIWTSYGESHVIALLQPQVQDDILWRLCSALEFEIASRVDCQLLVLPKAALAEDSPLVLETDRMLVQLEGRTSWQVVCGEITLDHSLACADVLFLPAGSSLLRREGEDSPSLVLQLIFNKRHNRLADLLQLVLPQAVAAEASKLSASKLGRCLPRTSLDKLGAKASEEMDEAGEESNELRRAIAEEVEKGLAKVVAQALEMLDPAADQVSTLPPTACPLPSTMPHRLLHFFFTVSVQMTKAFITERLPVFVTEEEEARTSAKAPKARILPYTRLRMLRPGIATIVVEDGKLVLYHAMDNSRALFGAPINPLEFELDDGPCIEGLLRAYPEPVMVSDLEHPGEDIEDKVGVAEALYKEGFLVIADEFSYGGAEGDEGDADSQAGGEEDDGSDDDPF